MKLTRAAVAVSFALSAGVAGAATQGDLDTTESVGTSDITIIKDNAVKISDVDDIDFETRALLTPATAVADDAVCVFSSTALYGIAVTSTNNFLLVDDNGSTDTVSYAVTWNGTSVTDNNGASVALTGLTGDSTSDDCNSGTNALFEVTLDAAQFNAAAPGAYSDTLTLTVTPG